jgi:hypothetical protein
MRRPVHRYLAIFLAVAAIVGLIYRAADRAIASRGCHQVPPDGHFLAYCGSTQFGDYEHGAYYYGLVPEAVDRLKRADVIFFGSSRAQQALSTNARDRFFKERSIPAYLLGFGYNEPGAFPLAVVRKHQLKPKAVVVLADPFFQDRTTGLIRVSSQGWPRWRAVTELHEYLQKRLFIAAGARFCAAWPSVCRTRYPTLFRSTADGSWRLSGIDTSGRSPVTDDALLKITGPIADSDLQFAERFIAGAGVTRDCVVLSAAPSSSVNSNDYVREMGRRLGVRVSLPKVDGLQVYDGSHLTADSAERWSAALLADIEATLSSCVRG